jgi:hypothetical protein
VKNKVAPPFKQAEFDIMYGTGFSWEGTVIDVAAERKTVTKSGSYFSFGDERLGQGRQNATAFLREHPDVTQQILQQIQLEVGLERKVVQKSGSYFSFGDERLGQGRQNATAFLREHPDIVQSILQGIQAQAAEGQVISARLLPTTGEPTEVTPVRDEEDVEAEPAAV